MTVLAPGMELRQDFSMWCRLFARVLLLAILVLSTKMIVTAQAQSAGSERETALLVASCTGCHTKSQTGDVFPPIFGRPAAEIREAMLAYRDDESTGTVMNRIAKGYSVSEIDAMAVYLAGTIAPREQRLAPSTDEAKPKGKGFAD